MKIKKSEVVAFAVALGFAKAADWNEEKMKTWLGKVPDKVEEKDVPEGHEELYKNLLAAGGKVELEDDTAEENGNGDDNGDAPAASGPPKSKKKKSKGKPLAVAAKAKAKSKPAPAPAKKVDRDAFGCKVGSFSARVNGVMDTDWQTDEEIASKAKLDLVKTRDRLYFATEQGLFERRRLIQYRLVKKAKNK